MGRASRIWGAAAGILCVGGLLLLGRAVLYPVPVLPEPTPALTPSPPPEPAVTDPGGIPPAEDDPTVGGDFGVGGGELPYDQLFITPERQGYEDGDLRLIIPKLNVDVPVLNGVDRDTLLRGVGLYDYAQLPGEGNRNVSIAGHRNGVRNGKITDNMPFYYLHTLEEGDYLYLTDGVQVYQYLFESATVVESDDWGPIYSQGYSCLTLTSCTPIGVSDHRIIIRGALADIYPQTEDADYPEHQTEEIP